MTEPPAIHLHELTKRYGNRTVVDRLTLRVERGARTVLAGLNGAGKSTTMEIVATLRTPTSGTVEVFGHDAVRDAPSIRRLLGLTPQSNTLDPLMTPTEVLVLQAIVLGRTSGAAKRRAGELVDLFGLSAHASTRLSKLSGGTRRRVDLALALVGDPQLIVLDEPTAGLDPLSRLELWDELRRLNRERGTTLFISTQDLHEAEVLASELLVLRAGRLAGRGSPDELKSHTGTRTLAVTVATPDRLAEIVTRLRMPHTLARDESTEIRFALTGAGRTGESWPAVIGELAAFTDDITGLRLEEPTLDDVFARLATDHEGAPA
ncbi:ABC transporter ATP-binding protein [Prescottella defluvii]|uniref:ABC transporter ATP-binding protein n=1 Tax=Prescottella defluvii TaxID=1323361 RepID=UPI0004F361D2|nr:ABC transporter ATP-binding protein [Prescottella defluvii]